MRAVAIVGAGDLGATLARTLAGRDCVSEIRLIDAAEGVAAGKALDIQQAGPIEGFHTRIVATGDPLRAAGAAAIVLADQAGSPEAEWQGEPALALLKRLAYLDPDAVLVCAGAAQRQLIDRGVRELGIARARLLGSAPTALAGAVRALVALDAKASPADVALSVLGVPPDHTVVAWSDATIAGHSLSRTLSPPQIARVSARLPRLWPPGPYALASAAARVCEAIVSGSRRRCSCFVALAGEFGVAATAAAPVVLGPRGIEIIVRPPLSVQEEVLLGNALEMK